MIFSFYLGPHVGTFFRLDALQDICFLKHTSCSNSTTGFANAEKDPEMARWLTGEPEDNDTNFSNWSITNFWAEAKKRDTKASSKPTVLPGKGSKVEKVLYQAGKEKKEKKRKAKSPENNKDHHQRPKKKTQRRIESNSEEESEDQEGSDLLESDDLDKPRGSRHGRR